MQDPQQQRQQKLTMIADWQSQKIRDGLSQKQYCLQHNIPYHVFHYWYRRSKQQSTGKGNEPSAFVKLTSSADPAGIHSELLLPDGKRLVFHKPVSADFLKVLLA